MSSATFRLTRLALAAASLMMVAPGSALAKKKAAVGGGGHGHGQAPNARAVSELAGKWKWGMTPDDATKVIAEQYHAKYTEEIKKEPDVYKQDLLRKQEVEDVDKVKASLIKFTGQKSGWDSSIVEKEFGHRNDESMLVIWEKDQRRFLFFWNDKLYKQYIAFNAEHPVFQGKSFDDFAKIIQNRYGKAEMKLASKKQNDDVTLDHLEWPSSNDYTLWALDQSSFYGNFCLKLMQTSVLKSLEAGRAQNSPKKANGNALIDAVTQPDTIKGDANDDVVDRITGRKH